MIVFFVGVSITFISINMLYFMFVALMTCMTFKHFKGYRMSRRMIVTLRAKVVKIDGYCNMIRLQGLAHNDHLLFLLFSVQSTSCLFLVNIDAQYDMIRLWELANNFVSISGAHSTFCLFLAAEKGRFTHIIKRMNHLLYKYHHILCNFL